MRRLITATAAAAVLLSGCGPAGDDVVADDPSPPPPRPEIELTVKTSGGGEGATWRLRCGPTGGDHPRAAAACERLRASGPDEAFAPVPDGAQCTMIYGGPGVATVTGRWGRQPVDARFERSNGCEIARWESMVPLLPDAAARP